MNTNIITRSIGYGFGIFALGIFIYSFFISGDNALKEQAIFWFYSALIASLIPQIKQFKYREELIAYQMQKRNLIVFLKEYMFHKNSLLKT